jgi:hypothetical protein
MLTFGGKSYQQNQSLRFNVVDVALSAMKVCGISEVAPSAVLMD